MPSYRRPRLAASRCNTLLHAAKAIEQIKAANNNERVGIDIVRKALQAQKGEFTDLIKAGIIDPTKVVRIALQDAASVAGLLITTEALITDKPEPKSAAPAPGGGDLDY